MVHKQIFFVRHGTTAANLDNRFAGRTAEPLAKQGMQQMQELAGRLRQSGIEQIIAGPLVRTRQSAEIIGAVVGAPVLVDERLTDMLIPHWDGLTKDAIRQQFGPEYPLWLSSPQDFAVAGCETLSQVQQRVAACVEELVAKNTSANILLVSHLIVLRCLVLHYSDMGLADFRQVRIDNGAIGCLEINEAGATVRFDL